MNANVKDIDKIMIKSVFDFLTAHQSIILNNLHATVMSLSVYVLAEFYPRSNFTFLCYWR